MGIYTPFQKAFWSDDYILSLSRDEKLVYSYLITNDKTQQCGIYELALSKAALELAMQAEQLMLHLKKFSDDKKIFYSIETKEMCIINWLKHNSNSSWKTMESIRKQLSGVKNPQLMLILYDPRKPLFDGTRKEKDETGKWKEVPYIIDNPWKDMFLELSDAELLEIREPFNQIHSFMKPLASPLQAPSTITITQHNNITTQQNNNNNKTETVETSPLEPFQPYKPEPPKKNVLQQAIEHWNSKEDLPRTVYDCLTIPKLHEILPKFNVYSLEVILKAIDNLDSIYLDIEGMKPTCFHNFFANHSIDIWVDDANPFQRYEKPFNEDNMTKNESRAYTRYYIEKKNYCENWTDLREFMQTDYFIDYLKEIEE